MQGIIEKTTHNFFQLHEALMLNCKHNVLFALTLDMLKKKIYKRLYPYLMK